MVTYAVQQLENLRDRAISVGVPHETEAPVAVEVSGVSASTEVDSEEASVGASPHVSLAFCASQMRIVGKRNGKGRIPYDTPLEVQGLDEVANEIAQRRLEGYLTLQALVESNGQLTVRFQGIKKPAPAVYPAGVP